MVIHWFLIVNASTVAKTKKPINSNQSTVTKYRYIPFTYLHMADGYSLVLDIQRQYSREN